MKNNIEIMFSDATTHRDKGNLREALNKLNEIINLFPNHSKISVVFTIAAGIYSDLKEYRNSNFFFKRATEINPKSELASLGLYLSYVKLCEYNEAIQELERYLKKYPANRYKITLKELLNDLEIGNAQRYKKTILELAIKNNVNLGSG